MRFFLCIFNNDDDDDDDNNDDDDDDDDNNRIERRKPRFFFFFTISSLRRELSPTRTLKWPERNRVQITCNTSCAYHAQMQCATWYEGTAQLLCRTELKSHLLELYLYWPKPLTDEGGEETGVPRENSRRRASENDTY